MQKVRRTVWRQAQRKLRASPEKEYGHPRKGIQKEAPATKNLKGARFALGKAPEHLTEKQRAQLTFIAKADKQRYRAYLLKEKLRLVFQCEGTDAAKEELDRWIKWAQHKTATEVFPISSRSN